MSSTTSTSTVTSALPPVASAAAAAPAASASAPAPAAAPTREEQIADAVNKLSLSALANKRIELESKSGLAYIVSAIDYYVLSKLWVLIGLESYTDKTEVTASIKELNNSALELAQAVGLRALTAEEAVKAGVAGKKYSSDKDQHTALVNNQKAKDAYNRFYKAADKRCDELQIDRNDISKSGKAGIYALARQRIIEQNCNAVVVNGAHIDQVKIDSTVQKLSKDIYDSLNKEYAKKFNSPAEIKIKDFAQRVSDMNGFFKLNPDIDQNLVENETGLRQAFKTRFGDEAFKKAQEKYANPDSKSPEFRGFKQQREADLKAEKTKSEARLKALNGKKFEDKTSELHKAQVALKKAKVAMDKAKSQFANSIGKVATDVTVVDGQDLVNFYQEFLANENKDGALNVAYFTEKYHEYEAKLKAFNEAQKTWDDKLEERDKIASYQPGSKEPYAGKLVQINETLRTGLDQEARKEMDRMAKFYAELAISIKDEGVDMRKVRSDALHKIIDPVIKAQAKAQA